MKKSTYLMYLGAIIILTVSACGKKADPKEQALQDAKNLYEAAEKYKDANTARVALNQLLLLDPENIVYLDSLARLYIKSGNFDGGIAISEKLVKQNKASKELLELVGVAYQQQEKSEDAITVFGDLFESTKDYRYLYQQVVIMSEKGAKQEFDSLMSVLKNIVKESDDAKATLIDFPTTKGDVKQMVPLEAAVIFLEGKVELEANNFKKGINLMVKAIELFPDFEMPKYYLQQIEMMQRGGGR